MPTEQRPDRIQRPAFGAPRMAPLRGKEPPAFEVQGLTKSYGPTPALTDLTVTVPRGSVYAMVGPNGSGKSTLFKLIAGLIRADRGSVRVLGTPIRAGFPPPVSLALVPQGYALYDYMTVAEHVAFSARFYPQRWDAGFVDLSLSNLDLDRRARVGSLSQGQRAQLALILALGQQPEVMILDEPTASLDPIMRREVHRLVIGEAASRGQTILLSSHNLTEVERVADRVGFLRKGRLMAERVVEEIRSTDHEIRVVFQAPPTIDLASLPGVEAVEQKGTSYRLRVAGELDGAMAALQSLNPFALEVVEQSLEELFFALNDGSGSKEG